VVVRPDEDGLLLDHLYVLPEFQNRSIGFPGLVRRFKEADEQALSIKVGALKESASNRFYLAHGFEQVDESEWDNHYVRPSA